MRTLKLTLNKKAFEVMVTGEKTIEFREPTQWIKSRLWDKNGKPILYDAVEFTNGYGHDKPRFTCKFRFFRVSKNSGILKYSNGLVVLVKANHTIYIHLGEILKIENYENHAKNILGKHT